MMNFRGQILLATVATMAWSSSAYATNSSTTHDVKIETEVVSPLGVSTGATLNFGDIVTGASAGTVAISTAGARTTTGGVTLASGSTTAAPATLTVTGAGSAAFSVAFSSGATLALSNDQTKTMTVGTYVLKVGSTADQTSAYTGTLTSGSATLKIGATLSVGDSTANPQGSYATDHTGGTPLTVTVTYN